jgi:hypothetical protein
MIMEKTIISASIEKQNYHALMTGIEKLNRFFNKKNLDGAKINIVKEYIEKKRLNIPADPLFPIEIGGEHKVIDAKMIDVNVMLPIPEYKLYGYDYIASVSNREGSTAIYSTIDNASQLYNMDLDFECSHCHSRRFRIFKAIFVKDNVPFYIGSKCATEYFGIDFVKQIEKIIALINGFTESFGTADNERRAKFYRGVAATIYESTYIFNLTKKFVSRKRADDIYNIATADRVNMLHVCLVNPKCEEDKKICKEYEEYINEHKELINGDFDRVLDYWNNMNPANDFDYNLKEAIIQEDCNRIGLIVYGTWAVLKDRWIKKDEQIEIVNDVIGQEKEKRESNVELVYTSTFQSGYGTGNIYKFKTDDNYMLTYFATKTLMDGDHEIRAEWKGRIKYTIKGRNDYQGKVSTTITRATII